jgi:hypothetical protein
MPPLELPPPPWERGGHSHSSRREYVNYFEKEYFNKAINYVIFLCPAVMI